MIIQVQTGALPRLDGRYFKRKLRLAKLRMRKNVMAKKRRVRSRYLAWHRSQYFISSAYRDLKVAITRNEDIFITMCIIAVILGFSYASVASELIYSFFLTAYIFSESSGFNVLLMSIFALSTLTVVLAWLAAFVLNTMSISILHGANLKRNKSVKSTVREGLRLAPRTTSSWVLVTASWVKPLAMAGIASILSVKLAVLSDVYVWFGIALGVALYGTYKAARNLLRYSLVPYVSLFELGLNYDETFDRSEQLLSNRGKHFMAGFYGLMLVALGVYFGVTWLLDRYFGLNQIFSFGFLTVLTLMLANGIMVMLDRKRRLARS